eukprot:SAG22_NODE_2499_length_2508_cov_1.349938_2_plen_522_part_00
MTVGSGGTAIYMSPERLSHQPATAASDVYALGVVFVIVLFEQLCDLNALGVLQLCCNRAELLQHLQSLPAAQVLGNLVSKVDRMRPPSPSAQTHLFKAMLHREEAGRPTATEVLEHPFLAASKMLLQLDEQKRAQAAKQAELDRRNPMRECLLCCSELRRDGGIECSGHGPRHFLCTRCFSKHVVETLQHEVVDGGLVFCPMRKNRCADSAPFTDKDIAQHCPDTVFSDYDARKHQQHLPPGWSNRTEKDCPFRLVEVQQDKIRPYTRETFQRSFEHKMKASAKVTPMTTADQKMDRLRVHKVMRVENKQLFEDYLRERDKVRKRLDSTRAGGTGVARLEEHAPAWLAAQAGFPDVIDSDCNEFRLWHGTSAGAIDIKHPDGSTGRQDVWRILAEHGFDERVGGLTNGGLYGLGSYFADAVSKADQYSSGTLCKAPTNANGHHCMLSCRVIMGDPFMAKQTFKGERRPPNNKSTPGLPYDSVFAKEGVTDRGQGPGSQFHNEYVVFSKAQVYPEFVIWYTK